MDEAGVRQAWEERFAAPVERLRKGAGGTAVQLGLALLLGLVVPLAAAAGVFGLLVEDSGGLEGPVLWAVVGLITLGAGACGWVAWTRLLPRALSADARLRTQFFREYYEPAVAVLRPGWRLSPASALTEAELFEPRLFNRVPLQRFERTAAVTGDVAGLPFVMHEVRATGSRPDRPGFLYVVLDGYLAQIRLPHPLPGRLRVCPRTSSPWRRPPAEGFLPLDPAHPLGEGDYHVERTGDGPDARELQPLMDTLGVLAQGGSKVHVAVAGARAWIAVDTDELSFVPRALPYTSDHLMAIESLFRAVEHVAARLPGARSS
ncbi:MAG TPA: hypothetical protein VFM29_03255 [Vicinamibacteria bacterium]|nr:hypothetical protein [Vicinamibacteria bacterium]